MTIKREPKTWEHGAHQAAEKIWDRYRRGGGDPAPDGAALLKIRYELDSMVVQHGPPDDVFVPCASDDLALIGASALHGVANHDTNPSLRAALFDIQALTAEKQHDYGQGNIQRFGLQGILIRMSDKVERLKNLASRDDSPAVAESVLDAWRDLVGYAIVGIMFLEGTFTLPLAQDVAIVNQFMVDTEPDPPFDPESEIPWPVYCNQLGDFYANFDGSWVPLTLAEGMYTFGTTLEGVFVPQWRI